MHVIYLVRHAESEWVQEAGRMSVPVFGGRMPKVPLSTVGCEQAKQLGTYMRRKRIRPTAFYASPAVRAVQTCRLSLSTFRAEGARVHQLDEFIELDWGQWERKPRAIAQTPKNVERLDRDGFDFRPPGGESFRMVRTRAIAGLMKAIAQQPDGSRIMVHTHKNVIKALVFRFMGWTVEHTHAADVGVLSMTRLNYERPGGFQMTYFNRPTIVG